MTKNHTKKQIFLLIGIFCCIALGSNALNFSPNSSKTSEQSMDVRTAGTNNYRSNLSITWGGGCSFDYGYGIALDASGNIYITGETWSFGAGSADAFIAKYDSAGNSLLNITWGGSDYDYGYGIALDDDGNIYITGYTEDFCAGHWGFYDAFIAKYSFVPDQDTPVISGYNLLFLIGFLGLFLIILTKKNLK